MRSTASHEHRRRGRLRAAALPHRHVPVRGGRAPQQPQAGIGRRRPRRRGHAAERVEGDRVGRARLRSQPPVGARRARLTASRSAPTEWRAIVGLGGGGTVRQLGDRLEVSDLAVGGTVKGLIERGMAILDEPTVEPVDEDDSDPTSADDPAFAEPNADPRRVDDLPGFGPSPEVIGRTRRRRRRDGRRPGCR